MSVAKLRSKLIRVNTKTYFYVLQWYCSSWGQKHDTAAQIPCRVLYVINSSRDMLFSGNEEHTSFTWGLQSFSFLKSRLVTGTASATKAARCTWLTFPDLLSSTKRLPLSMQIHNNMAMKCGGWLPPLGSDASWHKAHWRNECVTFLGSSEHSGKVWWTFVEEKKEGRHCIYF